MSSRGSTGNLILRKIEASSVDGRMQKALEGFGLKVC